MKQFTLQCGVLTVNNHFYRQLRVVGRKVASLIRRDSRDKLLSALPQGSKGAEIGVHLGEFSKKILRVVRPTELHLVDPWLYQDGEKYDMALYGGKSGGQKEMDERHAGVVQAFAQEIESKSVFVHRLDSVSALKAMQEASLDWVYIDGNHLYEFVRADLEASFRVVRAGGWITGDDYIVSNWWGDGVIRAVDNFCKEYGIQKKVFFGNQFMLQRPASWGA